MNRTQSSVLNFSVAMIGQGIGLIVSFIARIFFVRILGSEYLGLNGLFTNILSVLSLAELGVGTAITYSLYKPLANNNTDKCKMLMQLYKKIYTIIGLVILVVGIAITPFLDLFISDMPDIPNISLIYILFVVNTAISYFFSYKRNLIIADQHRYIATIYRYGMYIIYNIAQIIYLVITKDYIGFLVIQILSTLIENILVSIKANKMYPYLKDNKKVPLDKDTRTDLFKKTKAMMIHKIGGVVVNSTDNILLSSFVSLTAVGLYSNYYLITNALNTVIGQVYTSVTASIGNLCTNSDKNKQYQVFKNIDFLTFWIYAFCSVCLLILFNPFIELWLGNEYLFTLDIVIVIVINFYITGMRKSVLTYRDALGLFEKDRYKPIVESIINLVASILLAIKFGTLGVFLGTFISSITTCIWVEPYVLYKYGFNEKLSEYFKIYFKRLALVIVLCTVTYFLCSLINVNVYLAFILKCIICLILPNLVLYMLYKDSEYFKYFYDKIFSKVFKMIGKLKKRNS